MGKKFFALLITVFLILNSFSYVFATDTATLYSNNKVISITKSNITVTGNVPVIKNLTNPVFQSKFNTAIENTYNKLINNASANKIKNLKLSYDIVIDGSYLSVILYATNPANSASNINTLVINKDNNNYASINSILGSNGVNYSNKVIEYKIKNDKTTKYYSTPTVTNDSQFFYKNGNITILFGAGTIAPASKGVRSFEIQRNKLKNVIIKPINYYSKPGYNVKMVPLRSTIESLGYSLSFNSSNNRISISKGNFTTYLTVGRNSYTKGNTSPRQLEFAPEIRNGYTYVPISFFGQILDLLFSVDAANNNVVISQYTF